MKLGLKYLLFGLGCRLVRGGETGGRFVEIGMLDAVGDEVVAVCDVRSVLDGEEGVLLGVGDWSVMDGKEGG